MKKDILYEIHFKMQRTYFTFDNVTAFYNF